MQTDPAQPLPPPGRRPIPALPARPVYRGEAGIVQRSFPYGPANFTRLYLDEPLLLTVTLSAPAGASPLVMLHTDIGTREGDGWREIPFQAVDRKTFRLELKVPACGYYRYRVKYSLNGGDKWFWDRVPHSFVLVDPPSLRTVRLYTLIPSASGTITDWTDRLPGLAAMGFDALHLLPVTPPGASESPYSARALFDVDPRFHDPARPGSALEQFEVFAQACRRHGLRLCLDLVLNHIAPDSELAGACPEWIVPDDAEPDGFKRAGCWHLQTWIRWEDLVVLNYDHPNAHTKKAVWDYMKQYALFWSHYAAYTGGMVRFDNLHSSRAPFIAELSVELRRQYPCLSILGEYFTDELTLERTVPEWGINLLLANSWEHPFGPELRHYIRYLHTVGGRLRHLCAVTTHDTGVPAQLFGADRSIVPRYAICALFSTGQTGLTMGAEAGVPDRIRFIGPTHRADLSTGPDFRPSLSAINALLAGHGALRRTGNLAFVDGGHAAVLGAWRKPVAAGEAGFLLLANLDIHQVQHLTVDFAAHGLPIPCVLEDQFRQERVEVRGQDVHFALEPCGVRAFLFRASE